MPRGHSAPRGHFEIRGHSALLRFVPRGGLTTVPRHSTFRRHSGVFGQGFQQTVVRVIRVWNRDKIDRILREIRQIIGNLWFSVGFTRNPLRNRLRPTGGCSSRTVSTAGPLQVICLFPQWFSLISGKPCSDPVVGFFLPSRKCLFLQGF